MVLMQLVGATLCLFGALLPRAQDAPVAILAACAILGYAYSAVLWRQRDDRPVRLLVLGLALLSIGITVLVVTAATGEGAVATTFSYLWMLLYVAVFVGRRAARWTALFVLLTMGAALWLNESIGEVPRLWASIAVTAVVATETLAWMHERLGRIVATDPLTGVLNRHGLEQVAQGARAAAERVGKPSAVAVIDLDDFKAVNDRDGHAAGDQVLVELTASWVSQMRASDYVARYGGDEFVVVMPAAGADEAEQLLARLRVSSPVPWSYGVCEWQAGETLDAAVSRADRHMYVRKQET